MLPAQTGELFDEQTPAALADALRRLAAGRYRPAVARAHALRFDKAYFRARVQGFLAAAFDAHCAAQCDGDLTPLPSLRTRREGATG
ncbi:MAG: hypothetical protein HY691_16780 [Chloroflexi bacterium]|nr:hypothetical protein [Chloroflexota bacterium]